MPPDLPFALALASVTIAIVFVVGYRAAKRRGRRAWLWASASLLLVPLVVLLQLRHRDWPSVAPDWLGWVNRYSFPVIGLELVGLRCIHIDWEFYKYSVSPLNEWIAASARLVADLFLAWEVRGVGNAVSIDRWTVYVSAAHVPYALLACTVVAILGGLAVFRLQPLATFVAVFVGVVIGFFAEVIGLLASVNSEWTSVWQWTSATASAAVVGVIAVFLAVVGLGAWLLADGDDFNPDLDLTTAPPLPVCDTMGA